MNATTMNRFQKEPFLNVRLIIMNIKGSEFDAVPGG
jgi:hypothetical protein